MKKKKKTLYIRRVRVNLKKKRTVRGFKANDFITKFNLMFRRRVNILKKKSFIRFLNKFESTNFHKVFNFVKYFGMNKKYRFFNFELKSKKPVNLLLKFKKTKSDKIKLKVKKNIKNNKNKFHKVSAKKVKFKKNRNKPKVRSIEEIKLKFISVFHQKIKFKATRLKNIKFKEKLCLYFSYRHMMYLPVRGQRTKTNAKTRKDFYIR